MVVVPPSALALALLPFSPCSKYSQCQSWTGVMTITTYEDFPNTHYFLLLLYYTCHPVQRIIFGVLFFVVFIDDPILTLVI